MNERLAGALTAFVRPVIERHRNGVITDHPIYVNYCLDGRIECMQAGRMLALVVPTANCVALLYRIASTNELVYYEAFLYSEVAEIAKILDNSLKEFTSSTNDCIR